ncbi:MAG TPA: MFS transporter [Myxococcales bacterium]|nr:MFS transporter [Myxococcales bacterium]
MSIPDAVAPVPPSPPARGRFIAFRSRDFRLLLAGQAVSLTGSQMQQVAVVWQLYQLTRSPLSLGMLGLFRIVPILVFALGGGVVADALDRRRMMLVTQTLLALVSVALTVLAHAGQTTPAAIYGLAFVAGAATAFDNPARQALVPRLVDRAQLPNALSLYATVWQVATIAGPALGGALLAWTGATAIYVLDVVSFGAVIAALLAMEHRHVGLGASQISARAALDGLRFIRRTPLIWSTMLLDFAATFFAGSMLLLPIFADQLLRVGTQGLGLLYSAQPVGAAIAGAALSTFHPPRRRGQAVLWAVAIYGAAITVFGLSPWFWLSFAMLALSGAADTVSMVIRQTLRQTLTPDELRGRMSSVNMIFFMGGPQLGEVEAGVLARLAGVRVSVASGGLLCAITAAAVAALVPALRRYEE